MSNANSSYCFTGTVTTCRCASTVKDMKFDLTNVHYLSVSSSSAYSFLVIYKQATKGTSPWKNFLLPSELRSEPDCDLSDIGERIILHVNKLRTLIRLIRPVIASNYIGFSSSDDQSFMFEKDSNSMFICSQQWSLSISTPKSCYSCSYIFLSPLFSPPPPSVVLD